MEEDKYDLKLNMEPLFILRDIALDKGIREVGGSLQIAKVYKSGRSEFFGILWPSSQGKPYFQGREYTEYTKPNIRYINPDTCELIFHDLPQTIANLYDIDFGNYSEFVSDCYPNGKLKSNITERENQILKSIFQDIAYTNFLGLMDFSEEDAML